MPTILGVLVGSYPLAQTTNMEGMINKMKRR